MVPVSKKFLVAHYVFASRGMINLFYLKIIVIPMHLSDVPNSHIAFGGSYLKVIETKRRKVKHFYYILQAIGSKSYILPHT